MSILFTEDLDPAMRYEKLYRFAFDDCARLSDPWEEADQSNYCIFMEDNMNNAKASLCRIVHKLIFDNYKNTPLSKKLIEIEKNITEINSQEDSVKIIDKIMNLISSKNNY